VTSCASGRSIVRSSPIDRLILRFLNAFSHLDVPLETLFCSNPWPPTFHQCGNECPTPPPSRPFFFPAPQRNTLLPRCDGLPFFGRGTLAFFTAAFFGFFFLTLSKVLRAFSLFWTLLFPLSILSGRFCLLLYLISPPPTPSTTWQKVRIECLWSIVHPAGFGTCCVLTTPPNHKNFLTLFLVRPLPSLHFPSFTFFPHLATATF